MEKSYRHQPSYSSAVDQSSKTEAIQSRESKSDSGLKHASTPEPRRSLPPSARRRAAKQASNLEQELGVSKLPPRMHSMAFIEYVAYSYYKGNSRHAKIKRETDIFRKCPPGIDPNIDRERRFLERKKKRKEFDQKSLIHLQNIQANPLPGNYDLKHLQDIHAYLFQDLPKVAGKLRVASDDPQKFGWNKLRKYEDASKIKIYYSDMTKANQQELAELMQNLNLATWRGLAQSELASRLADFYAQLDYLHPFYDGNSRSLREFLRLIAKELGYQLEWTKISHNQLYLARDFAVINIHRERSLAKKPERTVKAIDAKLEKISQSYGYQDLASVFAQCLSPLEPSK